MSTLSVLPPLPRVLAVHAAAAILALTGCNDRMTEATRARAAESAPRADAAVLGEATSSVRWNAITRDFIAAKPAATKPNPVAAFRAFAYLSLAQYRAVTAAEEPPGH